MVTWTSAMQTLTVCRGAVKYPQVRSSLEGHTIYADGLTIHPKLPETAVDIEIP